jgi:hypothetical protein
MCTLAFLILVLFLILLAVKKYSDKKENFIPQELQNIDPKIPTIINRGEFYSVAYLGRYIDYGYVDFWTLSYSWSRNMSKSFLKYDKPSAIYLYNRLMTDHTKETKIQNEINYKNQLYDEDHFKVVKKEDL